MEVARLGAKSELQLPACTTATATWDPSCICGLHSSSRQCQILNPLSEARDRTCIFMDTSWVRKLLSHSRSSPTHFYISLVKLHQDWLLSWVLKLLQCENCLYPGQQRYSPAWAGIVINRPQVKVGARVLLLSSWDY